MATANGPNLGLLVHAAEGDSHYTELTKLLRGLDLLVMCTIDAVLNAPPGAPADGKAVVVGPSPSGAFVGHENEIARYSTVAAAWEFYVPREGWTVEMTDEPTTRLRFDGTEWLEQDLTPTSELPPGGTTGQVLAKNSGTDGDVEWVDPAEGGDSLPTGGTTGQVLAKASGTDGDATWQNPVLVPPAVVNITGGTYTVETDDANTYMRFTENSTKTVTVPTGLPSGEYTFRNVGTGLLTLSPSGTTLSAPAGGTLTLDPGMTVTLKRVASDTFDVIGQTVAA